MNHVTDVAIIGAGPSGLFMVFEAGFLGYTCVVMDALPHIGGQLAALYPEKPIYDIPGHPKLLAGELVQKLEQQAAPFSPTYLLGEPVETLNQGDDGSFTLSTASHRVVAKVVVIAGGGGMFIPRKPAGLPNLKDFEDSGAVAYAIRNKAALAGKPVVLAGGGDSAVDWAVELASPSGVGASHVHVVHRRNDFRAADETVRQMHALADAGRLTIHTPYQLAELIGGDGRLRQVAIADLDGNRTVLDAENVVCCFGLAPNPGPFAAWGLKGDKGVLDVDRATMQTSAPGILAIGDIAGYEGKVALILTGFAEAAVAAKQAQAVIHPEKKFKVQYSTSKGVPG